MSTPAEDLAALARAASAEHTRRGQPLTSSAPSTTPEAVGTGSQGDESELRNGRDHVVFDFKRRAMVCGHCEAAEPVDMPISVNVLVEQTNAFLAEHEGCREVTP
ncbi:MAG: hypothetical protein Q8K32_31475 [Archangium sp.]|nr:hypothetical protein [Archangium sp.]